MQIRTLHLTDFLNLGRMHQADIGLNLPFAVMMPELLLSAALAQQLPVNTHNSSIYIYEEDHKVQAFAHSRTRQRRLEWEILSLGVVGDVQPEPAEAPVLERPLEAAVSLSSETKIHHAEGATLTAESVETQEEAETEALSEPDNLDYISSWPEGIEQGWLRLLEYMVMDAGEKGILRIYARIAHDAPQLELFTQTGFHTYTHENIFCLPYTQAVERPVSSNLKPKEQRNRDAWNIQQLYVATTPTFVQNSEQYNSRIWEIHKSYIPGATKESGWLLLEAEKAVAYVRILNYRNRYLLRIMSLDDRRDLLPDLLRFVLSTIKAGPDTQIYCLVREYQMEQEAMLEELGFAPIYGQQAILVKHTVQFVRATERQKARVREGKLVQAHRVARPNILVRFIKFLRRGPVMF